MLMKYKDFKQLSVEDMKQVKGGAGPNDPPPGCACYSPGEPRPKAYCFGNATDEYQCPLGKDLFCPCPLGS